MPQIGIATIYRFLDLNIILQLDSPLADYLSTGEKDGFVLSTVEIEDWVSNILFCCLEFGSILFDGCGSNFFAVRFQPYFVNPVTIDQIDLVE